MLRGLLDRLNGDNREQIAPGSRLFSTVHVQLEMLAQVQLEALQGWKPGIPGSWKVYGWYRIVTDVFRLHQAHSLAAVLYNTG
jgi:hypothetical protein